MRFAKFSLTHSHQQSWPKFSRPARLCFRRSFLKLFPIFFYSTQFSCEKSFEPRGFAFPLRPSRLSSGDGNHKKLIARRENNIMRDYFHSSAGFSPFTQKQQRDFLNCPWIIDFSALFLCATLLLLPPDDRWLVFVVGSGMKT